MELFVHPTFSSHNIIVKPLQLIQTIRINDPLHPGNTDNLQALYPLQFVKTSRKKGGNEKKKIFIKISDYSPHVKPNNSSKHTRALVSTSSHNFPTLDSLQDKENEEERRKKGRNGGADICRTVQTNQCNWTSTNRVWPAAKRSTCSCIVSSERKQPTRTVFGAGSRPTIRLARTLRFHSRTSKLQNNVELGKCATWVAGPQDRARLPVDQGPL